MEALSSEANEIKEDIAALESRIKRFCDISDRVSEWFEDREWLVSQFNRLLLDSNNKDSSSVRTDYLP